MNEIDLTKTLAESIPDKLPVAVLDLPTLAKLGVWEEFQNKKDFPKEEVVLLKTVRDQQLVRHLGKGPFLWVSPNISRKKCRKAWVEAGFDKPMNAKEQRDLHKKMGYDPNDVMDVIVHQLDHVHANVWASKEGYGYVLYTNISSNANQSAGPIERIMAKKCTPGYANIEPVRYASKIHWEKLIGFNQTREGQPIRNSLGVRVYK